MNTVQIQKQVEQKLRNLNANNPIESLRAFIKIKPANSKNIQLVRRDLQGFQFLSSKINEKDHDNLINILTENQATTLIDYLHRFMQYVGETDGNIISGSILKLYEKIIKKYGSVIIINSISKPDTLVTRINNF